MLSVDYRIGLYQTVAVAQSRSDNTARDGFCSFRLQPRSDVPEIPHDAVAATDEAVERLRSIESHVKQFEGVGKPGRGPWHQPQ